jgi:cation diffusion facilitator CzcD-associated flavoprotein CzcO
VLAPTLSSPSLVSADTLSSRAGLRPSIKLSTTFLGSRWSEATHRHTITLQHKGAKPFEIEAEFLISATGPLSTPNYPNIPGLDQFEGAAFHCYKWDSSYQLEGKRIGVIGNGSSGVQMVVSLFELRSAPTLA